ncbi:MAG: hypothetical protein H7256_14245 [Bdellovibrio sp.]|nr:hypothetical protein [Bdellovibrio sp.]
MADTIQTKNTVPQQALQSNQQAKAERKAQLMAKQKEDLKAMKEFYAEKNKEIDNESAAAVNHISGKQERSPEDIQRSQQALSQVYTRAARTPASANNQPKTVSEDQIKKTSKETDDFYKVQDRGSKLTNDGDKYVIEAYAPQGEQNNLRMSVQANKAVISGQRKNNAEIEQGSKKLVTNNFQTFREEFKFDKPVSHEGMTRERVGDFVKFTIPKQESIKSEKEES